MSDKTKRLPAQNFRTEMKQKYWLPLLFALTLGAGIWLGVYLSRAGQEWSAEQKLSQVLRLIEDEYVDEVSIDSLVEMAVPSLLENLDPHSSYISAKDLTLAESDLEGSFSGIGVQFEVHSDTVMIVEILTGGPAEESGLNAGDKIVKIDGKVVAGKHLPDKELISRLRGEEGSKVVLSVKRAGSKKLTDVTITRGRVPDIVIESFYMLDKTTGYIKVKKFARTTYEQFLQTLTALRAQGAENFVIDLRGNTGGYLEPAVLMANEFLNRGDLIVSLKGRDSFANHDIRADGTGLYTDVGLSVIIDEFTASSSEIFSGAMQDNDRGWIVGRRSFGKGLVQSPIMLPDSSQIRLTVQRYYTPSGRSIQKDYKPGANYDYESELYNRYVDGELLSEDSVKINRDLLFRTAGGREVYGGGGIVPDKFVPNDTTGVTSYYVNVVNNRLISKFAYEYTELNADNLKSAKNVNELLSKLPANDVLLNAFVRYASLNGVPARWYYINISSNLIVTQLKALIARDIFGTSGYYEVVNRSDKTVQEALRRAAQPLTINN